MSVIIKVFGSKLKGTKRINNRKTRYVYLMICICLGDHKIFNLRKAINVMLIGYDK